MKTIPSEISAEVKLFTANYLSKSIHKRKSREEVADKLKCRFETVKKRRMEEYTIKRKSDALFEQ